MQGFIIVGAHVFGFRLMTLLNMIKTQFLIIQFSKYLNGQPKGDDLPRKTNSSALTGER